MFTLVLLDSTLYVVSRNGMLYDRLNKSTRKGAIDSYMYTAEYMHRMNVLANDSIIL
jgi:hypothetical protein